jgi:hypothetical protein
MRYLKIRSWTVLIYPLVALGMLGACAAFLMSRSAFTDELFRGCNSDPWLIETNAHVRLPPSARDLHVCSEGVNEIFTQARFTIAAGDLPALLASSLCTAPPVADDPRAHARGTGEPDWWQPGQAQTLLTCSGGNESGGQSLFIDTTDPRVYIVYVSAGTP